MKKVQRTIAISLLAVIVLTNGIAPVVQAAEVVSSQSGSQTNSVNNQVINKQMAQISSELNVLALSDAQYAESSAVKPLPIGVMELENEDFEAGDLVSLTVNNPDRDNFTARVVNADGQEIPVETRMIERGSQTEVVLAPTNQFVPGKFTLEVKDAQGVTAEQDFTWGVLALNTDKSRYKPGEEAAISIGVLDDKGEMVCNADVELKIRNIATNKIEERSTKNNTIKVNSVCTLKEFTLEPDYETQYTLGDEGVYEFMLSATTENGSYTISDTITVTEDIPFDVKRTSATRLYPPLTYPMNIEVTATEDFTGTITETVPDSFIITPTDETSSYDGAETVYLNGKDPETTLAQNVLGATTGALQMPFDGSYGITQGFGSLLTDVSLRDFYSHYGLSGHDGIDFALPTGTPLYAVDDGNVLLAGDGDYGITIVIEHSWGRSYYGHLSKVSTQSGLSVKKGSLIGYSGNTGESTGPHLHFGMKPANPDLQNGYMGKIDPSPYLNLSLGTQALTTQLQLQNAAAVLSASTSAEAENASHAAEPQPIQSAPAAIVDQATPLETTPTASQSGQSSLPFTVLSQEMEQQIADSENFVTEKVKVITWQVSLKKGEKTTLSYAWKAPSISPQFYLLGTLKVFNSEQEKVYEDARKWQLAADAQGAAWYDYAWLYRKEININDAQVPGTLTDFPVVVSLASDAQLVARAQADGDDIIFTDSDRTLLDWEIESWNNATGALVAWVKVPTVNGTGDTDIYMYYGNSAATNQEDPTNVWDSNYRSVYHMAEDPDDGNPAPQILDSTTNALGLTTGNGFASTDSIAGKIGPGVQRLSDSYMRRADNVLHEPSGDMTISGWIRATDLASDNAFILYKNNAGSPFYSYQLYLDSTTQASFNYLNNSSSSSSSDNTGTFSNNVWYFLTGVRTSNTLILYVNGSTSGTVNGATSGTLYNSNSDLNVGNVYDTPPTNSLDEVRISATARSANWIQTEYNNQNSPGTFYTLGSEETKVYAPANSELMRHGKFFDSRQAEQAFVF